MNSKLKGKGELFNMAEAALAQRCGERLKQEGQLDFYHERCRGSLQELNGKQCLHCQ